MKSLTTLFVAVVLLVAAGAAPAAADDPFAFPVIASSPGQGSFEGTFTVKRFAVVGGALVAAGALTGTLTDETGAITSFYRSATLPVIQPVGAGGTKAICDILHLELGPLDLDLLGLIVHLDKIVLDIDAESGPGNLLGNLLCAIVGIFDGPANPLNLATMLNEVIRLLGA